MATSSANGGAVSIQDINSGGNVGNAISVGDTACGPYTPPAAPGEGPAYEEVVELPSTGVGCFGDPSALLRAARIGRRRGHVAPASPPLAKSCPGAATASRTRAPRANIAA